MIVSKCPLRVSLVGGSTDLRSYLDKYGTGSVISFPANLYTYITLKQRKDSKYRIVYSSIEEVEEGNIDKIKNDIVREALKTFPSPPCDIIFTSDVPASGSGLASSTSYLIALLYALAIQRNNLSPSQYEICAEAHTIEKKYNPLVGYQDPYGCGLGGLKRINFVGRNPPDFRFLPAEALNKMWMYLVPTNIQRSSTKILETLDVDKIHEMSSFVDTMESHISSQYSITGIIRLAWEKKKSTSPNILTPELGQQEKRLLELENVKALKLCGAGGGGYFLVLARDRVPKLEMDQFRIHIDNVGVTGSVI